MKNSTGFTLIELLIVVSLVGIVLGIGVPSFQDLMRNNRAAVVTNQIVAALQLGRSEAVKRGRNVTICRSADGNTCSNGTDWSAGWLMWTTLADGTISVLRVWNAPGGDMAVTGPNTGVTYTATGAVTSSESFTVQNTSCTGEQVRNISVSLAGYNSTTKSECP